MKIDNDLLVQVYGDNLPRLEARLIELTGDIRTLGLRFYNGRKCLTGYSYGEFYDWDLYFENIFLSYYGVHQYCRNGVEMFLDQQLKCGFVARTIIEPRQRQHFKPFLAQIALLGCRQAASFEWLNGKYYDKLKKYLDYWFWYCDLDKNGLCVWDSADHSGMDNQDRRAGAMFQMTVEGVDLNCYLVRELLAMKQLAHALGRQEDEAGFKAHAQRLAALIDIVFWNEQDGFYYDRDERTGAHVRVKAATGFIPMFLGTIPADRAERLVQEHLLNPEEFWLNYPVATWSKSEPDYYQERKAAECTWMGATWVPVNYMIFHGLLKYGYKKEAKALASKTCEMALKEETTREYYNGETGAGQGLNPFWGWSALAYIMPLEAALEYDPTEAGLDQNKALIKEYFTLSF